jgi:GGDEF domain-containing protein
LIATEYTDLSGMNEKGRIKNKTFLKKSNKIRRKLLKLISRIKSSSILDQLERNSRSSKPGSLDHEKLSRIIDLKEKLARQNPTHLSCIILDVDDYTILSYKYPEYIAPRVLSMIETKMGQILSGFKTGRFTKKYNYIYDGIGRDKYIILVTLGKEAARTLAIKMCRTLAEMDWADLARGLRVTCSAGVDEWRMGSEEFKECIIRASAGLDKAKITRKNSVQRGLKMPNRHNRLARLKTAVFGFLYKFFL